RAVLGRGKRIDPSARDKAAEILRLHREDPEALAAYNLEDARLVPEAASDLLDVLGHYSPVRG
ncbi:MAG: hypothetical protein R3263_03525, partial [Myxococcota bacterium]|nr:hypothetical protein [Myxococcota bacterium]